MVRADKIKNAKRFLVLNLITDTIGDTLFLSPVFKVIKNNYPDSFVACTISPKNQELLENCPHLDELIPLTELKFLANKKLSKIKKTLLYFKLIRNASKILRSRKFDVCFIMLPKTALTPLIPLFSKIPVQVGYKSKFGIFDFLMYKKKEFVDKREIDEHFIYEYLDILALLDLKWKDEDLVAVQNIRGDRINDVKKFLKEKNVDNLVSFQIGAKGALWDWKNFAEVADHLIDKYNFDVMLLGAPHEEPIMDNILNAVKNKNKVHKFTESLQTKAAMLKLSKFALCHDSGLAHMSSCAGTKTIDLFGPTSPKHAVPMGPGKVRVVCTFENCHPCSKRGTCSHYTCMKNITPKDVIEIIDNEMLKEV